MNIERREKQELITKIAGKLGELCGAAKRDWQDADPAAVGLHGMPVKGWREGYFEGCKDMAGVVAAALPAEEQDRVKELARVAFDKAFNEVRNEEAAQSAE